MKFAGAEVLIWIIIAVVVALFQGWKQLQQEQADEEPAPPPRPKPTRPARPRPATGSAPPPIQRPTPPLVETSPGTWTVDQRRMEEFRRKLAERLQAKVVAPPPVVEVVAPPPVPAPEPAPVEVVKSVPAVVAKRQASRLGRLLQQPATARDFVVGAEILGPPLALRNQ